MASTRYLAWFGLQMTMVLAGCVDYKVSVFSGTNLLSFDHPFTDKAIAEVRAEAKKGCERRKQVAIQTQRVCTLAKCSTVFQCEDEASILRYGDQADVVK